MGRIKIKLNNLDKIAEVLQEQYNEADKSIVDVERHLNKLSNSVDLNNEIADAKAKIAKAINDFLKTRHEAISKKLEIAKMMIEIHKYNGNIDAINNYGDTGVFTIEQLQEQFDKPDDDKEEYTLN